MADVATTEGCAALVAEAASDDALDGMVLNVGIGRGGGIARTTAEDWDATFAVNLRGPYFLSQLVARHWRERQGESRLPGGYKLIFVSSISAVMASVNRGDYCVSKAGIAFGSAAKPKVFIQLPPIFSGTDVRDALPFINFNQFVNQVQFGEVAIALNAKIAQASFANVNVDKLKGKKVTFTGAFTRSNEPRPLLTPITIEVSK